MSDRFEEKSWFQRKLETPCFRSSLLTGISSGIGAGLLFFLFTSRQKIASRFGFTTYIGVTLVSWTYCRYQLARTEVQLRSFRNALEQKILLEGTINDPRVQQQGDGVFNVTLPSSSTLPSTSSSDSDSVVSAKTPTLYKVSNDTGL